MDQSSLIHQIDELKKELERYKGGLGSSYNEVYEKALSDHEVGIIVLETKDEGNSFILKDFNEEVRILKQERKPQLVGKNILDVLQRYTNPKLTNILYNVWKTGKSEIFEYGSSQNGKQFYIHNRFTKLSTGEILYSFNDITTRKNNEIALRESKEKYKSLFANIFNGFGLLKIMEDENGKPIDTVFVELNDGLKKILGVETENIIGKCLSTMKFGLKKHYPNWIDLYLEMTHKDQTRSLEYKQESNNRWLSIRAYSPMKGYLAVIVEDITEQKKTKQSLKNSEEAYRQMFEENQAVKLLITKTGQIVKANHSAEIYFGYTIKELEQMMYHDLIADREEELEQSIQETLLGGKNTFLLRCKLASGKIRHLEIFVNNVTISERQLYYTIIFDVTEKVESLNRISRLYRAVDQSLSMIMITDTEGLIEYSNPVFEKVTGYSLEETKGLSSNVLKSGTHNNEFYREMWDIVNNGGTWKGNFRNKRKNETLYWESASISPVKNLKGEITGFIKVAEEITEKLEAEEKIKKSYNTFSTILNSMDVGVYVIDLNTKETIFTNDYIKKIKNTIKEELNDNSEDLRVCPKKCDTCHEKINQYKKEDMGEFSNNNLHWECSKQIKDKWYTVNNKIIKWIDGRDVKLTIITNITKIKITEEELKRSNRELDLFAHKISHELKNPLAVVISFINIMRRNYFSQVEEEVKSMADEVSRRTKRMIETIDSLLSYSEVGVGQTSFKRCDTNKSLKHAIENLELIINESGARIHKEKELPVFIGDETQIMGVFQNLISNAIKYTEKGKQPIINISVVNQQDKWKFSVKDNGIGIKEKDLGNIFYIFHRLHKDQKGYSGSGIGLSSCKKIVSSHKGRIWVESEEGKGSTFYFTISKYLGKNSVKRDL